MGIKMKHEGNVTSRVVAANLGGQAQSSQQQATAAAQRAASENMAANKQIDGARAQAAHANTTSAAATHATPGSAGTPTYDVNFADEIAVGNDPNKRPSDTARWDSRKGVWVDSNYYGFAARQATDQVLAATDVHKAALDRSLNMNAAGKDTQTKQNAAAAQPQVQPQPNAQPQVQPQPNGDQINNLINEFLPAKQNDIVANMGGLNNLAFGGLGSQILYPQNQSALEEQKQQALSTAVAAARSKVSGAPIGTNAATNAYANAASSASAPYRYDSATPVYGSNGANYPSDWSPTQVSLSGGGNGLW